MAEYMLGFDLGTSSSKVTILKSDGNVIFSYSRRYGTNYPKTGWAEQEPDEWYNAIRYSLNYIFEKKKLKKQDVVSLCIDGMMNSPVFLDNKGKILRSAIIWMDQRSVKQARWLIKNLPGDNLKNSPITATALLSKVLWVKENQPGIWDKTWKVILPKDFIRFKLTNSFVTDWSDASATQLFDVKKLSWSNEICEIAGIDKCKLPETVSPVEIVGTISREAAALTGLQEGLPVVAGCSDAASDNLTAGAIYPNQCLIRLGTCGALFMITDKVPENGDGRYYILVHSMPGRWMIHLATPAGLALEWFKQTFYKDKIMISDEQFDSGAGKIPVGSDGLIFHPYLSGEHTPRDWNNLRGNFIGITNQHTKEHFNRAILEGIAFSLKDCFALFEKLIPDITSVRAVGGGMKSAIWGEIITNVLGKEIEIPVFEDPSLGTCLLGGIGIGIYKDFEDAVKKSIRIKESLKPDNVLKKKYGRIFDLYIDTLDKLSNIDWI